MGADCSCGPKTADFFYDSSDINSNASDDNGKEFKIHFYEKTNLSLHEKENLLHAELQRIRSKIKKAKKVSKHKKKKSSIDIHPAITHKKRKNGKRHSNHHTPANQSSSKSPTPSNKNNQTIYDQQTSKRSTYDVQLSDINMNDNNLEHIIEDSPIISSPTLPPTLPLPSKTITEGTNYNTNRSSISSLNIGILSPIMSSSDTELPAHAPRISADMESKAWDIFNENPTAMFSPTTVSTISTNVSTISTNSSASGNTVNHNDPYGSILSTQLSHTQSNILHHEHGQPFHLHRKTKSCVSCKNVMQDDNFRKRSLTEHESVSYSRMNDLQLNSHSIDELFTKSDSDSESSDNATNNARIEEWKREKSPLPGLMYESKSCQPARSSSAKCVHDSAFPYNTGMKRSFTDDGNGENVKERKSVMEIDQNAMEMEKQLHFYEQQHRSSVRSLNVSFDPAMAVKRNNY